MDYTQVTNYSTLFIKFGETAAGRETIKPFDHRVHAVYPQLLVNLLIYLVYAVNSLYKKLIIDILAQLNARL